MASGSVQTKGTVGEELADERVGGKGDGNAGRVLGESMEVFGDWNVDLRKNDT